MPWSSPTRLDGASTVTSWPRARSLADRCRTCSVTPPGCMSRMGRRGRSSLRLGRRQMGSRTCHCRDASGSRPRRWPAASAQSCALGVPGRIRRIPDLGMDHGTHAIAVTGTAGSGRSPPGPNGDLDRPDRDRRRLAKNSSGSPLPMRSRFERHGHHAPDRSTLNTSRIDAAPRRRATCASPSRMPACRSG